MDAIFLGHLHFDHTGGLAAVLGLRFQTSARDPLTIYGPPGTRELVEGLLASMVPGVTANYGVEGAPPVDHRSGITVRELRDGAALPVALAALRPAGPRGRLHRRHRPQRAARGAGEGR